MDHEKADLFSFFLFFFLTVFPLQCKKFDRSDGHFFSILLNPFFLVFVVSFLPLFALSVFFVVYNSFSRFCAVVVVLFLCPAAGWVHTARSNGVTGARRCLRNGRLIAVFCCCFYGCLDTPLPLPLFPSPSISQSVSVISRSLFRSSLYSLYELLLMYLYCYSFATRTIHIY
jgi:hypothetical protein